MDNEAQNQYYINEYSMSMRIDLLDVLAVIRGLLQLAVAAEKERAV